MGCKEEEEQEGNTTSLLKLPLLPSKSHCHSNSLSSPIHPTIAVSVPFSWEEEPGKPKHRSSSPSSSSSSSSSFSSSSCSPNKSLELPPRLLHLVEKDTKPSNKLNSPTTVLDGPYSMGRSRRFESSSFRMSVMSSGDCYGSFRSDIYGDIEEMGEEEEKMSSGPLVLARKRGGYGGRLGFVRFWRKRTLKGKAEFGGGSYVFPSSVDRESECSRKEEVEDGNGGCGDGSEAKMTNISRTSSFSTVPSASKSHFWTTVYEGLKQAVPWKNKKMRI